MAIRARAAWWSIAACAAMAFARGCWRKRHGRCRCGLEQVYRKRQRVALRCPRDTRRRVLQWARVRHTSCMPVRGRKCVMRCRERALSGALRGTRALKYRWTVPTHFANVCVLEQPRVRRQHAPPARVQPRAPPDSTGPHPVLPRAPRHLVCGSSHRAE